MIQNATLERPTTGQSASVEQTHSLTQTLYREARMLDEENYVDWVKLLADDLLYHMPGIETRYRRDKTDQVKDLTRMAYYNDNLTEIKKRLSRLETGTAWSEDPATRYTHIITNVEVELTAIPGEYQVFSNFYAYRNRNEREEDSLIGNRIDIWREVENSFQLVMRRIILKHNVLLSKNLNIFL
ncbi:MULTISPECIES: 3-phenylpropionate/cinnamic acid dioxygenase subunit beta [Sphingobium]|jgi:ethylbenzene dioxygenase beta subunit|uniref:3-phenylpropionate/cinnamic acid dioxygenase subunit beta n=1 Tax=Sphingobium terrigena TaxID=2304063 RepID=A0A418YP43_9SPHN|nr:MULTISPECIES: 3-phenylpropionate/cinnamic acid dioxygenase subunit beta [Sphingobium]MBV2148243.1 3-phenylpropionate/cinnamic acid dioxygenase subunit beta [Sphingobium sp. AS12]PBN41584.1 3-phenylpropionate dioxygenase [Sphingobium sp. D43FB]RJG53043.1 3-phenylpropionate/cinnamic acid dioxygenase subunit beta [Sphingobium terrigena]